MTPKMAALLRVFVEQSRPLTPNEAGYRLPSTPQALSRTGKAMGPGSLIVPTLRALRDRGWIAYAERPDGRTGTAYVVTAEGRKALSRWKFRSRC